MKKRVYFAIAHKEVEDFIAKQMGDEIEVIGSTVYREGVAEAVRKEEPDVLVIRETIAGNIDFLEIIDSIRVNCQKHVQIIVVTGGRSPGDELLSALVRYSVFDLVVGDKVNVKQICDLIRKPNVWKDVSMYAPKIKIDEKTKKQVFEAPSLPKIIEKEVIRQVIVDNTDILDAEAAAKNAQEIEMIKKEKREINKEHERIQQEKEKIDKEKASLSQEKDRIQKEYELRQLEFEKSMELKLKSIDEEKERLISIEQMKIDKELQRGKEEIEKMKLEAEKILDDEKRKIHESKQLEMEKNIEIMRLEYEQKIKELEQEAINKAQLEQEKYNQNQLDEIEKFKLEKSQLEEKYLSLKEQEEIERARRDKESQEMQNEISSLKESQEMLEKKIAENLKALEIAEAQLKEKALKDMSSDEVELKLKSLEDSYKEKEYELEQEKELLAVKYSSLEDNLFSDFNKKKSEIEAMYTQKLEELRKSLKAKVVTTLESEKAKILADSTKSQDEKTDLLNQKQKELNEIYRIKSNEAVTVIKKEMANRLAELEKEFLSVKAQEEEKLMAEKIELEKVKESLAKDIEDFNLSKEALSKQSEEEKEKLEIHYKKLEDNLKSVVSEKEKSLESDRALLKQKEEELNEKMKSFEENQKYLIDKEIENIKFQNEEKERELELQKETLLKEKEHLEKIRKETEIKAKEESNYLQEQLKALEQEKELISKMKSDAANMSLKSSGSMSKNVITFLGCKSGVGTTTVAFNTAFSLAKKGKKVLYVELNKDFSTIGYIYNLTFFDAGIDYAVKQIGSNQIESITSNIVSLKDIKNNVSADNIMYGSYKKFPDTLDYLSFSGRYYSAERYYNSESFNELMMMLIVKLDYDYVVFDINSNLKSHEESEEFLVVDDLTKKILKYSSKIYFVVTQDIASIGAFLQIRKVMKKSLVPVNEFRVVLNRYDTKAKLSKKGIEDWLKVKIDLVMPDRHRDIIDANYHGNPLCLNIKDKELVKFFTSIETDVLKGSRF